VIANELKEAFVLLCESCNGLELQIDGQRGDSTAKPSAAQSVQAYKAVGIGGAMAAIDSGKLAIDVVEDPSL
jgi:hypothetical protein